MNYALVGAFVLGLGAVLVAGVLWLASGGAFQKKYDLYLAVMDESVAGLNLNAPVKYNGVDVGKVQSIQLDPANPEQVRLMLAMERGTPIKVDTLAVLKTQGLTGIAYVEPAGGALDAAPLVASAPGEYPVIRTKPSLAARLENVLTSVLAKLDRTSSNIDAMLSDDNRRALTSTLTDMAALAHTLAERKETLAQGIDSAARTLDNSARATAKLGPTLDGIGRATAKLDPTLDRIGRASDAVEKMGTEVAQAGTGAGKTIASVGADVQRFGAETLPELQRLLGELNVLAVSLRQLSDQTARNPAGLLFGRTPVPEGPGESSAGGRRP